jgi:chitin disaccharide deacetylase
LHYDEVRLETMRQIERFGEAGLAERHGVRIDGHQHLHVLPVIIDALLDGKQALQIRAMRTPVLSPAERSWRSARAALFQGVELLARRSTNRLAQSGIESVPCWGTVFAGHLTLERARAVLRSLPDGASGQLICHPGDDNRALRAAYPWKYDWEGDLSTILALGGGA